MKFNNNRNNSKINSRKNYKKLTGVVGYNSKENKKFSTSLMAGPVQNTISEFVYNPGDGLTFSAYFCRYKQIFTQECSGLLQNNEYE